MNYLWYLRRTIDRLALNSREFRFLFELQDTDEAVSIDCETTGFDPWVDDVISIAAIPIKGHRIMASEAYRAVVKPEAQLREQSIKVHQLRVKDVEGGRPITEVLPELLRFIGNRPIVGYWIDFDIQMLDKYVLQMLNIRLPNRRIDVCDLFYERKYGNAPPGTQVDLRYAAIMEDLNLPALDAHDPFYDALGAAEMYVILSDLKNRGVRIPRLRQSADAAQVGMG